MRSLGEEIYRRWHVERVRENASRFTCFASPATRCSTAAVGAALIYFSDWRLVPFAIGMGMIAYAIAVAFYTLLAIWRIHRAAKREARELAAAKIRHRMTGLWSSKLPVCARPAKSFKLLTQFANS